MQMPENNKTSTTVENKQASSNSHLFHHCVFKVSYDFLVHGTAAIHPLYETLSFFPNRINSLVQTKGENVFWLICRWSVRQ